MYIIFYLLKNVAATALLYGLYLLLLRDRVVPGVARAYLLLAMFISAIIPFVILPSSVSGTIPHFYMPDVVVSALSAGGGRHTGLGGYYYSFITLYTVMVVVFFTLLSTSIIKLYRIMRQGKRHADTQQYIVFTHTQAGPGSFGRFIFFPTGEVDAIILMHEVCHVVRRHTADIIVLRLLRCVLWPNFLLGIVLRELKMVHEYEADAAAMAHTPDYSHYLLNETFATRAFPLSNTFFSHPIKRRIVMLQKSKTARLAARHKIVTAGATGIMMMAGMIYLQSCRPAATVAEPASRQVVKNTGTNHSDDDATMPQAGVDLVQFLSANIKYPDVAKAKKIAGRVVVKLVIDEAGALVETEVKRSPDELLTAEALRVIKLIPEWKPGTKKGQPVKSEMYIPVSFVL
jgi:TonB family protein